MRNVSFVMAGILLCMSCIASGAVLLDEQFTGDLSNWTVLDGGGTTTATVTGGLLNLAMTDPPQYSSQGVESKVSYNVPTGPTGMLIVDYYGVNVASSHSAPGYYLSQYQSTGNVFQGWNNYIGVRGKNAYFGDWVIGTGVNAPSGYYALPTPIGNGTTVKHMIITVDAANINVYIADDYFENLVNPVAVYTTAVSSIFNMADWTGALYVNCIAVEDTGWYHGASIETFDGVKVTAIPEPMTLVLLGIGGLTILRKKQ